MSEIRVWKIVPISMVTTSEQERDKWIAAGHEVVEFVSIDRITQLETELAAALAQANVNEQSQAQQNHSEDALNMVQSQAQQTESQWISVEERLPKAHTTVLVVTNFDCIYTCRLPVIVAKNSALDLENGIRERFTHWMPLPPAPEGE